MIGNNWIALAVTFGMALIWLRINDYLAHKGVISARLSRKIIHIGTGPIFVLCWLLFDDSYSARYLAALVPFFITIQFFLVGMGIIKDQASVKGMSRSGDPREILRGPLYYGIVFVIITLVYWRSSPIGITALMLLCGGDGLADVLGNRIRSSHLPWSERKTWFGSASMFVGGLVFTVLVMSIFIEQGIIPRPISSYLIIVLVIAFIGTLVESLPLKDLDNISVPAVALLLGHMLF